MRHRLLAGIGAVSLVVAFTIMGAPGARSADPVVLSPSSPSFSYEKGPITNLNIGGLAAGSCDQPEGCDHTEFKVEVPDGYYEGLRAQGKVGVVQIAELHALVIGVEARAFTNVEVEPRHPN